MGRCVIIGGAKINNYASIHESFKKDDFFVFCDSGLLHRESLKAEPDLIVGDFDSHPDPKLPVETITLPCEKDDTDSVFAVKEALRRGFSEFLLLGLVGGRLDHTLGNVSILLMLDSLGKRAKMLDNYSEMEIVSAESAYISDSFAYFSLLNVGEDAKGVCIENAKFPLRDAEITCRYQYGISNEVLPGKTARVSVREGALLLVKVFEK